MVNLSGDNLVVAELAKIAQQNIIVTGNQAGVAQGNVFHDTNGNGISDSGEGLAGITVVVTDNTNTPITVITDTDGNWSTPVRAGDVTVNVDESDPDMPSNAVLSVGENPTVITVPGNGVGITEDGYIVNYPKGFANGVVFLDSNGNGSPDAGEGIPNINVIVTDSSNNPIIVVTDINGNWSTAVRIGDVTVYIDINDPDMPNNMISSVGTNPTTITVPSNGTATTQDGYRLTNKPSPQPQQPTTPIPATSIGSLFALLSLMFITSLSLVRRKK